jgi:putative SOS response-associated peptidase YedK
MGDQYTTRASAAEVAAWFSAKVSTNFNAGPVTVYPGAPGMVVRHVAAERSVDAMTWGLPMRMKGMKPDSKPRPVNNPRADKLDSFMWRYSFEEGRCIILVNEFAEAGGEKGAKTNTWFSLPDEPLFESPGTVPASVSSHSLKRDCDTNATRGRNRLRCRNPHPRRESTHHHDR